MDIASGRKKHNPNKINVIAARISVFISIVCDPSFKLIITDKLRCFKILINHPDHKLK
jgi:hypothetical protein